MSEPTEKLPDILRQGLKLVFCGTAAGTKSAEVGAYYAAPGNKFWPTLFEVGLTPRLFSPSEFPHLLNYDIGLTDLAKFASGMDHTLMPEDYDRQSLTDKIQHFQPRVLAFTSKNAAKYYLDLKKVDYGLQGQVAQSKIWVLPSTSGAATRFWDSTWWQLLAEFCEDLGDGEALG